MHVYIEGYNGCCGAMTAGDFPEDFLKEEYKEDRKDFEAEIRGYQTFPAKRIFSVMDVVNQKKTMNYLLKKGWKKVGRSWKNPETGNRLQQLTYYKPKRKSINDEDSSSS